MAPKQVQKPGKGGKDKDNKAEPVAIDRNNFLMQMSKIKMDDPNYDLKMKALQEYKSYARGDPRKAICKTMLLILILNSLQILKKTKLQKHNSKLHFTKCPDGSGWEVDQRQGLHLGDQPQRVLKGQFGCCGHSSPGLRNKVLMQKLFDCYL